MADGVKVKILGKGAFEKAIQAKGEAIVRKQGQAVARSVRLVEGTIKDSIRKTGDGIVYRRGKVTHQASSPGKPPASDTANLINLISSDITFLGQRKGYSGAVRSSADYSAHLEYGTRHMAPRPFMFPGLNKNVKEIRELMKKALNSGVNT